MTEQGDFAGFLLVGDHGQVVTGVRGAVQAEDLDRNGRASFFHRLAVLVEHGTDAAVVDAAEDHVALTQGTVLDQHGSHRATALVQAGLDHHATARGRRGRSEFQYFGLQQHGFQQFVDAGTDLGRYGHELGVAAPLFRDHVTAGQIILDPVQVGFRLVDLVHRDHDRHASRFRVLHGFLGLRHHAVVGRHHQDDDVGGLGTTGTHGGKRCVARGVEEGHHAAVGFHVVGADVLGDATRFTGRHLGAANVVEQRGLAMVDVTHDGDHRRARLGLALELEGFGQLFFQGVLADQRDLVAQLFGHQLRGFLVEHLVDGHRGAHLEHELDDFRALDRHLRSQFGHCDGLANADFTHDGSCWALEPMLVTLLQLALAASSTATEGIALFLSATRRDSGSRSLFLLLERRTVLRMLAIAALVLVTSTLGTTNLFLLALGGRARSRRRSACHSSHRGDGSSRRCGCGCRLRLGRSGLGNSVLRTGLSLATGSLFGALASFFLGLQASGLFRRALLLELALALGLDLVGAAFDVSLLLTYFNIDGLAAGDPQRGSGLALQGDLARLFHSLAVAALEMSQQGLLLIVGHNLLGAGVRQSRLAHLQQQALHRCIDHLGQFFHRDLRHALLSSGRNTYSNQWARAAMISLPARSSSMPSMSSRSSIDCSARSSRLITPRTASSTARSLSMPSRESRSSAGWASASFSSVAMALVSRRSFARARSSLTISSSKPSMLSISSIGT
ncbi:hypothetical protein D3C85_789580 [compost metagenome]